VLPLGVVLLVGALLPPLLENLVAQDLQDELGLAEKPEVNLESDPSNVLTGRFEGGRITLANPEFDDVRPDQATVDLAPFHLDVLETLKTRRIKSEEPLSGKARVELSEDEVARIAASSDTAAAPVREVDLEEGWMVIGSEAEVFGARVPIGVEGSLVLQDGALHFEPSRVEALGVPLPRGLTQELLRGTDFSYPISESPFEGTFSDVEIHKGRLVLSGEVVLPAG
jgi:hypothetical protein